MTKRRRARSLQERHCYDTGRHLLRLRREGGGWAVSVDGMEYPGRFATEVDAWSAGLTVAEGLDRELAAGRGRGRAQSAMPRLSA